MLCNPFAVVTIGFDPDDYTVNETDGSVTLMVRLISGVLERDVIVNFETTPGSATPTGSLKKINLKYNVRLHKMCILVPADYERTVRLLTFSPTVNVNPVPVTIFNDNIHEDSERFFGNLAAAADQPAILNPSTAVVTIIDDNDRKVLCCNASVHVKLCCIHICSYHNRI